jgi:hypothetical protein
MYRQRFEQAYSNLIGSEKGKVSRIAPAPRCARTAIIPKIRDSMKKDTFSQIRLGFSLRPSKKSIASNTTGRVTACAFDSNAARKSRINIP